MVWLRAFSLGFVLNRGCRRKTTWELMAIIQVREKHSDLDQIATDRGCMNKTDFLMIFH